MNRNSLGNGTTSPTAENANHIRLACQACQRKKIKCDRSFPCGQCNKSSLTCVPSSRKQRTRHAGKRAVDGELRSRISKLESLVDSLSSDPNTNTLHDKFNSNSNSNPELPTPSRTSSLDVELPAAGRYVANNFWSSLTSEFAALREALEDEDEEDGTPETLDGQISSPGQADPFMTIDHDLIVCPPGRIFVMPGVIVEPDSQLRGHLIDIFFKSVEPMMKIFHRPTLRAAVEHNADYLGHSSGSIQHDTLKRLVWLAAFNTMTDAEILALTGQGRVDTVLRHRRYVGISLSQLDLLNTGDLTTLQCFLLFITVCRTTDNSRRTWTSLALLVRNAQAIYLNQDDPRATPFIRELRKRLWHQINFLDKYCSLDRGSVPVIKREEFSIPYPTNTNDDLFGPSSVSIPQLDGKHITDMTFSLMCSEACATVEALLIPEFAPTGPTWEERRRIALDMGKHLEEKYLGRFNLSHPRQRLQHAIGKTIATAMIVRAVRPMQRHLSSVPPPVDSPEVLQMAVDNLETGFAIFQDRSYDAEKWLKWVPWHCLAVALAGLCSIRGTALAQQAWTLVEPIYQWCSEYVADGEDGMLWRPVVKLYRKALTFRNADPSVQTAAKPVPTMAFVEPSRITTVTTGMWSQPWSSPMPEPASPSCKVEQLESNFSSMAPYSQSTLSLNNGSMLGIANTPMLDFSNTAINDPSWNDWGQMMDEFNDPLAIGSGMNMDLVMDDWTYNAVPQS